jgi:prepilin-type N-terminal cleavage/methylation domain-containing protein
MAIKPFSSTGFTLVETLVVVSLFSVLALITAQSLVRVISNSSRTASSAKLRENMEYAMGIADRSLRNAKSITSCTTTPTRKITYVTGEDLVESIECTTSAGRTTFRKGTERLLTQDVNVTTCSIVCSSEPGSTVLNKVEITLEGADTTSSYSASKPYKLQTQVSLRSY